jgi:hypothetical protein
MLMQPRVLAPSRQTAVVAAAAAQTKAKAARASLQRLLDKMLMLLHQR